MCTICKPTNKCIHGERPQFEWKGEKTSTCLVVTPRGAPSVTKGLSSFCRGPHRPWDLKHVLSSHLYYLLQQGEPQEHIKIQIQRPMSPLWAVPFLPFVILDSPHRGSKIHRARLSFHFSKLRQGEIK